MNKFKKPLAMLLCAAMTFAALPEAALAEAMTEGACGEGVYWRLDAEGTLTISGHGAVTSAPWNKEILKSVIVEAGVTAIAVDQAFYNASQLETAYIGKDVASIGDDAFGWCENLKSVNLPENLKELGEWVFYWCSSLNNVVLPESVTNIPDRTFYHCASLTDITLGQGVQTIGNDAFGFCTGLTQFSIPSSVVSIGDRAFISCANISEFTFPDSLQTIGKSAFMRCSAVKKIKISANVEKIGEGAFASCEGLSEFEVDNGNAAYSSEDGVLFNRDKTLLVQYPLQKQNKSFVIPDTVTQIADSALKGNTYLTSINISAKIESIGAEALAGCENMTNITVHTGNASYVDMEGVLYSKDKITLVQYPAGKKQSEYAVPYNTKKIAGYAFYKSALEKIILPQNIEELGAYAFASCKNIKRMSLPASIKIVNEGLFSSCGSLERADLKSGTEQIAASAFSYCENLTGVYIPESVNQIDWGVFEGSPNVTVYGFTGSPAESYAGDYNIPFVAIDGLNPSISAVKAEADGGTVTVTVETAEISPFQSVMAVAFGSGGTVVDSAEVEGGSAALIGENVKTVKVFCWDSLESMRPLCEAKEAEVTR